MSNPPNIAPNAFEYVFEQSLQLIFKDEEKLRRLILAHLRSLSVADVAYLLDKSTDTINRWIKEGKWVMPQSADGERRMSVKDFQRQFDKMYKVR